MFGRTVKIDGTEVFVTCTPETPYSVILQRAALMLAAEEEEARRNNPVTVMYRRALR